CGWPHRRTLVRLVLVSSRKEALKWRMKQWLFLILLTLSVTAPGSSQVIGPATFTPNPPTSGGPIKASFIFHGSCLAVPTTSVSVSVVRTTVTIGNCAVGPPPVDVPVVAGFGPLAPGTYTYELYTVYQNGQTFTLVATQPLTVA